MLTVILCFLLCLQIINMALGAILAITTEVKPGIYKDNVYSSCLSQGFDYYDTLDLTCKTCATGMVRDASVVNSMGDSTQCKCASGYFQAEATCVGITDGTSCERLTCTACTAEASYSDHSGCIACDVATTTGLGTAPAEIECGCPAGEVLVEYDSVGAYITPAKICQACPAGTFAIVTDMTIAGKFYAGDRYTCRSCPSPHMVMDPTTFTCSCETGYTITGRPSVGVQSCVINAKISEFLDVENAGVRVTYSNAVTVVSETIGHYFVKAAAECKYFGGASDARACQVLANLCVLQLYDKSSAPCQVFDAIMGDRGLSYTGNVETWKTSMPMLYYLNSGSCFSTNYRQQANLNTQLLRYVVGSYKMDGTFNGYQPLDTFFSYCSRRAPFSGQGGGKGQSDKWQIYGSTESASYQCDLDTLLGQEQLFYEMFLYDPTAETAYLPVPMRAVNITSNGALVNPNHPQDVCTAPDLLVTRFMLFDVVSGLTSSSGDIPSVIRYAADITIEVNLRDGEYTIFSPVLSIYYGVSQPGIWPNRALDFNEDGTMNKINTARTVGIEFSGRYTQNMKAFMKVFYGWSIASGVFCGLHALYRFNTWMTRHNRQMAPGSAGSVGSIVLLWEFAMAIISSYVYFYFTIQLLICWYFFTFFKLQGVPDNLLPPTDDIYSEDSPYYMFSTNITYMFLAQVTYCGYLIYKQCNIDIFFLDWEPQSGSKNEGRVSVWRTIFVANEWTEMTTMRKIDIRMNLILLAFILIGCDQQYAATQQPDVSDLSPGKTNVVLRFANTTFWWLLLSFCQWAWKFLIYERFFSETREALFIDFCTIAKVSILVLDEPFHGYYLHCRSPHQHADGTMTELIEMLHKEEAGLTVDRSLDGGPNDVQTFQIFISAEWKSAFSKIYNNLVRPPNVSDILGAGRKNRSFGASPRAGAGAAMTPRADAGGNSSLPNEKTLKAWRELTLFLQEFVDNNFGKPALRRTIREPSYWEVMGEIPPDLSQTDQPNIFFPDRALDYTKVMFLGREVELLLCNIIVFSAFDMWTDGATMTAIFMTYIFDWIFCYVRESYGTAVTSAKTLIDDRFLM